MSSSPNYRYDQNCSGLIFIVVVASIIFYLSPPISQTQKTDLDLNRQPPTETENEQSSQKPLMQPPILENKIDNFSSQEDQTAFNYPPLIVYRQDDQGKTILKLNSDGKTKTLFYDRDLTEKAISFLGLSNEGSIFTLVGKDSDFAIGHLARISGDGKGQLKSIDVDSDISLTAAITKDEQKVALIEFNNLELDFGFKLLTNNLITKDKKVLDRSPSGLGLPRWSSNGHDLAYIKGQATPNTGLQVAILRDGQNQPDFWEMEKNQTVTDLTWLEPNRLILAVEPLGNNAKSQTKLRVLELTSGKTTDLVDLPGQESSPEVNADGKLVALVLNSEPTSINNHDNKIIIYNLETNKYQEIFKAKGVIGWNE